jgi:hypothetical protein
MPDIVRENKNGVGSRGARLAMALGLMAVASLGLAPPPDLELRIASSARTVRVGQRVAIRAILRNLSPHSVQLVQPGDGSGTGSRTPILTWHATEARRGEIDLTPRAADPFINGPNPKEIFELQPGAQRELLNLDLAGLVAFDQPGAYRVRLVYENDPDRRWCCIPSSKGLDRNLAPFRKTTRCRVESNEIEIEVR